MSVQLLILSNLDRASIFRRGSLHRALRSGLESRPIEWCIHNPAWGAPRLAGVDVVLTWCHHIEGHSRAFRQIAIDAEDECRAAGIPVVNSARNLRRVCHSFCLRRWLDHDIPCALSQRFSTLDEIVLRYPMILRVDGGSHSSLDSFLVSGRAEAEHAMREREASQRARLNLAIEFVETQFPDGFYRKRRSIVVGDRIIPRQHMLCSDWKVKLNSAEASELAIAENRRFLAEGEARGALVGRAAKALGCDILAIDYSPAPDGSYVFWEANHGFRMAGTGRGPKSAKFREATGWSAEECLEHRRTVGGAIADWILRQAGRPAGS